MIHDTEEASQPYQPQRKFRIMKAPKVAGSVQLHGFSNLLEAMAVKNMVATHGLNANVVFSPGTFEFRVRRNGYLPYDFHIEIPVAVDKDSLCDAVADCIDCNSSELSYKLAVIKENNVYSLFYSQLEYQIYEARAKLDIEDVPFSVQQTFLPQQTQPTIMNKQTDNTTPFHTSQIAEAALEAVHEKQPHQESINMNKQAETIASAAEKQMESLATTIDEINTAATTVAQDALKEAATITENVADAVAAEMPAIKKSFFARHKKNILIGAGALAAVAAVAVGIKNSDKIMGLFGSAAGDAAA